MVTLYYDFDYDKDDFEYETDLDDWKDSLDFEDKLNTVYIYYKENPDVLKDFGENIDIENIEIFAKKDPTLIDDMLDYIDEDELLHLYKDNIEDFYYSEAEDSYNY